MASKMYLLDMLYGDGINELLSTYAMVAGVNINVVNVQQDTATGFLRQFGNKFPFGYGGAFKL